MSYSREAVLNAPFEAAPLCALVGREKSFVAVRKSGLTLQDRYIAFQSITGYEVDSLNALFSYKEKGSEKLLSLQFSSEEGKLFQKQFNLLRLYHELLNTNESLISQCPSCELLYLGASIGPCRYCPECQAIYRGDDVLTSDGSNAFNYCPSGYFQLLSEKSPRFEGTSVTFQSFQEALRPTVQKICGHILWMSVWSALVAVIWWSYKWGFIVGESLVTTSIPILVSLSLVSFLFIGYFATGLALRRSLKPLLKLPPWEKWTRSIQKGRLTKAEKSIPNPSHPGLLSNLALGFHFHKNPVKARHYLDQALALCPEHSALKSLDSNFKNT